MFNNKLEILKNNSESEQTWSHPTAKVLRSFYFFEILNSDELETGSSKIPNLKQRGIKIV